MTEDQSIIPVERIEGHILLLRGKRVILSLDLAVLYDVEHRTLNQAVKRNQQRFPEDFMFQLNAEEVANLKSQFVTSSWGGSRTSPYAFTEQGVAMLSSVLNSQRAIQVNIEIMRAFVRLRQMLVSHADLTRRLDNLERKYDSQFKAVFDAIRQMMSPSLTKKKRLIGFVRPEEDGGENELKDARNDRKGTGSSRRKTDKVS